jgi:hypothetical protein
MDGCVVATMRDVGRGINPTRLRMTEVREVVVEPGVVLHDAQQNDTAGRPSSFFSRGHPFVSLPTIVHGRRSILDVNSVTSIDVDTYTRR